MFFWWSVTLHTQLPNMATVCSGGRRYSSLILWRSNCSERPRIPGDGRLWRMHGRCLGEESMRSSDKCCKGWASYCTKKYETFYCTKKSAASLQNAWSWHMHGWDLHATPRQDDDISWEGEGAFLPIRAGTLVPLGFHFLAHRVWASQIGRALGICGTLSLCNSQFYSTKGRLNHYIL